MRVLHQSLFLIFLIASFWVSSSAADFCLGNRKGDKHYLVYLIPRLPATQLYHDWSPLLERIGKENGLCFELKIPKTFAAFEEAIVKGTPDFSLLNPYHQVLVAHTPGYIPLVRDRHSDLAGVVVVSKESDIRELRQLEGKTVAFPAPNAYVASLLIRAKLLQEGIHMTPEYVGSHSNVYRSVALGTSVAGGGANTTLAKEPPELLNRLRVLYTSETYTPHPFSAHPRVAPEIREKVRTALIKTHDTPEGRQLLKAIQMPDPVVADYARDYQKLELLHLETLVEWEGK